MTSAEASGMSSAAVAQAAADAQTSTMPIKEALAKASYITLRAAGAGGKTLVLWSDPLCPNCRDFEQKILAKLPANLGVTVIPVSFKHGSRPLASYAACASAAADRAARWKNLMSEEPKDIDVTQQCETGPAIADANTALFARAGLRATPTLMKPDGQMFEGDLHSSDAITSWLGK
jgi:protein-disulfide isomerase